MASSAGRLIVEIIATTAQFQSDLGKASAAAEQHARRIDRALAGVKSSIVNNLVGAAAAVGGVFSVAGIVNWAKSVIDAAENLRHLSIETGSTVEDLSRLQNIAAISGTSFDAFRETLDRLAAGIGGAETKGTRVGEVLKLLGVQARDPAKALQELSDALNKYADNSQKAALLQQAFRLSGVQLASMFKQIAENSSVSATKTAEQAKTAAELAERVRALQVQFHLFSDVLLNTVSPAITRILEQFTEGIRIAGGFWEALRIFSGISPFASVQKQIEDVRTEIDLLANTKSPGEGILRGLGLTPAREQQLADLQKRLEFLKVLRAQELGNLDFLNKDRGPIKPNAPILPPRGMEKSLLEADLRTLDLYINSEQDLLRERERFLADYYRDDEIGIEDYFSRRAAVLQEAVANEKAALAQEETLIRRRMGKAEPAEAASLQKNLAEVQARSAKLDQDAAVASIQAYRERGKALEDFRDKVEELSIAEAEAMGDPNAALARFDFEHRKIIADLELQKNSENELLRLQASIGLAAIENGRKRVAAQDALNAATADFGRLLLVIDTAQSRIDLAVTTGTDTEIQGLNARSELAKRYVGVLEGVANAAEQAALKLSGMARTNALLAVDALRLRIQQLAAETDLLARKFRDVFETSFADALTSLVTRTKSAKDALRDMLKSIEAQLTQIAAKNVSEQLFGKGGLLGGVPDFFAGIFGKGGLGIGGEAALATAGATLNAAGLGLDAAAVALQGAAVSLSTAGAASSIGGGFGSFFPGGSVDSGFGLYANGTNYAPGGWAMVGERGPEVVNLPRGAQVIPNDVLVGRRAARQHNITINIAVPGSTTSATAAQIAREVGIATQRAIRASGRG